MQGKLRAKTLRLPTKQALHVITSIRVSLHYGYANCPSAVCRHLDPIYGFKVARLNQ